MSSVFNETHMRDYVLHKHIGEAMQRLSIAGTCLYESEEAWRRHTEAIREYPSCALQFVDSSLDRLA